MGTGTAFTAIGWLLALACAWVAVSSAARVARHVAGTRRLWNAPGWPLVPLAYGCASLALLTALGVLPVTAGALLAAAPAAVLAVILAADIARVEDGRGRAVLDVARGVAARVPRAGLSCLRDDLRALLARRGGAAPGQHREEVPPAAGRPAPAAASPPAVPAAPAREVPPVREDPALAPAPEPAEVAAGLAEANVTVPEPWAALIHHVATRVAETSADQERFLYEDAAGFIALCEAYHASAGNAVDEIGLDPAFGEALLDVGDAVAPVSGDVIQAVRRFRAIYEGIIAFAENGGVLPFNTRDFFGGHGGAAPRDGTGEAA